MSTATLDPPRTRAPRLGESAPRPDGAAKVQGRFAFGSDLHADDMIWGATVRSPHAHARILGVDVAEAMALPGVLAVLTAADVPGRATYGLEHADQPVLASEVVRYVGEAVAVVAADHPETARRAVEAVRVTYQPLPVLGDPEAALTADPIHPDGNVVRHLRIRHSVASDTPELDPAAPEVARAGLVTVSGFYEVGTQDQAFLGPESGLAVPDADGGIDLHISTQWLHVDRDQVAASLGLRPGQVRLHLAGVGGAFGAREDVSLQIHACLLALRTKRPVKMMYRRDESFVGHVHRHPARMWYRHHATPDGRLVRVEARLILDGGAYASSSSAVIANATCFAAGPYKVPEAVLDGYAMRTNNPPCGAMRGFGAVQTCFAHEAQMDRLAAALGMDPVELRLLNALESGDTLPTGQVITGTAPVAEVIRTCVDAPLPGTPDLADVDVLARPGGTGRVCDPGDVRRGVGVAVGFKNLCFSEGFDDYSTARATLAEGRLAVKCACAEVGQGFVTLVQQIAREVLGVDEVHLEPADTTVGSAGSTSASRQTWMSGGAVMAACERVRERCSVVVANAFGLAPELVEFVDGRLRSIDGSVDVAFAEATAPGGVLAGEIISEEVEFRHAPTFPLNADGQGDAHVSFAFAAHRATVDVDPDLGLVRVVDVTTSQDVGRVLNPVQAVGQLEGGIAQGVGLAVMEELVITDGVIRNASFTDYLLPTALDMPTVTIAAFVEQPEPGAPFGAKGIGEPPTISSTAAVVAAIRAATGRDLNRVPVRPSDICLDRNGG